MVTLCLAICMFHLQGVILWNFVMCVHIKCCQMNLILYWSVITPALSEVEMELLIFLEWLIIHKVSMWQNTNLLSVYTIYLFSGWSKLNHLE